LKILVVGLNPSRKHGQSKTLVTLYKWLDRLNINMVSFVNLYEDYEPDYSNSKIEYIKTISRDYTKIIALGNAPSSALHDMDINHFKLPHPSGLNRQINDPRFVDEQIVACKYYLYGDRNEIL
jgi:hypothetical protein